MKTINEKRKVLDHGFIRLVDSMGSDLSIVRNARTSYDAAWRAGEDKGSDNRLISYLHNNGHNTPFECTVFTFEVKAPISVLRQWHRHRTQAYSEVSARYTVLPSEFYIPEPHLVGRQNKNNKQMRDSMTREEFGALPLTEKLKIRAMLDNQRKNNEMSFASYKLNIANGMPRELARGELPVNTYSHMFATVNLHNLFGFLRERLHEHAQYEIRVYAEQMLEMIRPIVPVAVAAFEKKQAQMAKFALYLEHEKEFNEYLELRAVTDAS